MRRLALALLLLAAPAGADYQQYLQTLGSAADARVSWHLAETSGTSAATYWNTTTLVEDWTGTYTNSPTLNVTPGALRYVSNAAITCDGSNDYVTVPDRAGESFIQNGANASRFTFLAWLKPTGTGGGYVASKAGTDSTYEWGLTCSTTCSAILWQGDGGSTYMGTVSTTSSLSTSRWDMIALVFDGMSNSEQRLSIFFNGVREGTTTTTSGTPVAAGSAMNLCRRGDNVSYWAGSIDEPVVWGSKQANGFVGAAISAAEQDALWKLGTGRQPRRRR